MTLNYNLLQASTFIGTKSGTTRTSVALPTSYNTTATKTFSTKGFSAMVLDVLYTVGTAETNNSVEIKVEDSLDGTNFYRLTNESSSAGTSTLTAREFTFVGASAGAYAFSYRLDITYPFIKISCKESGVAANAGTVYIEGVLGGQ